MADPATNTAYPASVEELPEISSNTKENDPGQEHDVMHDKAHATLNALQVLLGTTVDTEPSSVLGRLLALEESAPGGAGRSTVTALTSGSTVTIDLSLGDYFTLTLAHDATIAFSNPPGEGKGFSVRLRVTQDGTGNRTLTQPAAVKLTPGSDGAVQAASGAVSLVHYTSDDNGATIDTTIKARGT